jgi:hypothetical protein
LASFEKSLGDDRVAAATRIVKAATELGAALQDHGAACRAPLASWPHDLFPDIWQFDAAAYSHVASHIAAALRMQSPGAAHTLLVNLPARLGDLVEREAALRASLIEDRRLSRLIPFSFQTLVRRSRRPAISDGTSARS